MDVNRGAFSRPSGIRSAGRRQALLRCFEGAGEEHGCAPHRPPFGVQTLEDPMQEAAALPGTAHVPGPQARCGVSLSAPTRQKPCLQRGPSPSAEPACARSSVPTHFSDPSSRPHCLHSATTRASSGETQASDTLPLACVGILVPGSFPSSIWFRLLNVQQPSPPRCADGDPPWYDPLFPRSLSMVTSVGFEEAGGVDACSLSHL